MTTTRGATRERRARRKRALGIALASVVSAATVARAQRWVSDATRRRDDAKRADRASRPTDRPTDASSFCA